MNAIRKIESALKGKLGFLPTPGPWFGHFNCVSDSPKYGEGTTINRSSGALGKTEAEQANNEYIAAVNPAAIREVLQTLASKEAELADSAINYVSLFGELQNALGEIERMRSLTDAQIDDLWIRRDCIEAIQAGDICAQVRCVVRAALTQPTE